MNISQKCNCCIKEDVCRYKEQYVSNCESIKRATSAITEVSIKCKHFEKIHQIAMRGEDNGNNS